MEVSLTKMKKVKEEQVRETYEELSSGHIQFFDTLFTFK